MPAERRLAALSFQKSESCRERRGSLVSDKIFASAQRMAESRGVCFRSGATAQVVGMLTSCIWSLFWLIVLVYLAYTVAFVCAFWYITLVTFVPCVPALKRVTDGLHKGVRVPYVCSENFLHGRNINDGIDAIFS
ncbi:hypothetical protein HPB49_014486 [Dermacentor silvarum]|uniref:Uncharacterized protein n=1 Tax=Dermacentor silvarum TaxID=543639 RepID=A0ACB8DDY3_DERSI|nr:hypothetical protein HPB49_014486 [Dermacentor silvarum]